jgi:hypothetical protein
VRGRPECSTVGRQRVQALEGAQDRAGPGPVGGEMQRGAACMAGELPGDVQDAVTKALGLGDAVLAVEGQKLCLTKRSDPFFLGARHPCQHTTRGVQVFTAVQERQAQEFSLGPWSATAWATIRANRSCVCLPAARIEPATAVE